MPVAPASGRLAANLTHFARLLRGSGLPIGPGRVIDALRALEVVDVTRRGDFYWALHAVFVHRRDQHDVFDRAFRTFWRDPFGAEEALAALLPPSPAPAPRADSAARRVRDAGGRRRRPPREARAEREPAAADLALVYSPEETLRTKDFEQMSAEEAEEARRVLERLSLPVRDVRTRRFRPHRRPGQVDPRATLRASVRSGGTHIPLQWRTRRTRPPGLVVLCDISGSMEPYSRMLLHFVHVLGRREERFHVFLFGTRLTNVTRLLRHRDVDEALRRAGSAVEDWSGGTRLGSCLEAFNRRWSRRVLAQGAVVLLISDGLDRDDGRGLEREMARLHRSCRRLIWLNPLLRYRGFEPRAAGIRAMLPHVDDFRPVHDLESLEALAEALRG